MNYQETVNYLYECTPVFEHVGASAYKEGLDNTHALDKHFGHPHQHYKIIHIAGTNGKGSCSHTLAAILQAMGYNVGLYTSPHLVDFRERIRVNGEMIPEEYVVDFVEKEKNFFTPLHPSFFELTTAMAFRYFAEKHVDYAIVEVGLGGRLDCTNIVTPILSIITNISKDHTQFLGETLPQIAAEKAGIIKPNTPVVIGEAIPETRHVFEYKAIETHSKIIFAEDACEVVSVDKSQGGGISYQTVNYGVVTGALIGEYQIKNTNTVLCAIRELDITDVEAVKKGFLNVVQFTGLMGRWQILCNQPLIVCDTGHNVGGWKYLSKQINHQECHQKHIVFGMVDDKDIDSVMELLPKDAIYYWTQATTHRAIPSQVVAQKGLAHGLVGRVYDSVESAYMAALANAVPNDFVFIGGSSYIVSDLLACLATPKE